MFRCVRNNDGHALARKMIARKVKLRYVAFSLYRDSPHKQNSKGFVDKRYGTKPHQSSDRDNNILPIRILSVNQRLIGCRAISGDKVAEQRLHMRRAFGKRETHCLEHAMAGAKKCCNQ